MQVLGIIPARGGSKILPRKNMRIVGGYPLLYHTLLAARESEWLSRIMISTDDREIASFGRAHGIEVPFLRSQELAGDDTPTLPVIQDAVRYLAETESYRPEIVVILQPTSPLRRAEHIDKAVSLLVETSADSVVSVVEVPHQFNPLSVMRIEGERLVPFLREEGTRILRRQDKPKVYARNGAAVYAVRRVILMERDSLFGDDCRPLVMEPDESVDVDGELDLLLAELLLKRRFGLLE